ncbi:MAG: hypothetical protein Q9192_002814 [Flavoplaca navasiana]
MAWDFGEWIGEGDRETETRSLDFGLTWLPLTVCSDVVALSEWSDSTISPSLGVEDLEREVIVTGM